MPLRSDKITRLQVFGYFHAVSPINNCLIKPNSSAQSQSIQVHKWFFFSLHLILLHLNDDNNLANVDRPMLQAAEYKVAFVCHWINYEMRKSWLYEKKLLELQAKRLWKTVYVYTICMLHDVHVHFFEKNAQLLK